MHLDRMMAPEVEEIELCIPGKGAKMVGCKFLHGLLAYPFSTEIISLEPPFSSTCRSEKPQENLRSKGVYNRQSFFQHPEVPLTLPCLFVGQLFQMKKLHSIDTLIGLYQIGGSKPCPDLFQLAMVFDTLTALEIHS